MRVSQKIFALTVAVALLGCHGSLPTEHGALVALGPADRAATLVTDSTEYTVHLNGWYRASIGFVYTNRGPKSVSLAHCNGPTPPALEKNVDGRWVVAYSPISLMCLTLPHFRVPAGSRYAGTLLFAAAPKGKNMGPVLMVDSVTGVYRLRWVLRAGDDPSATNEPLVEAISNEFRLVER